ncbi:MAG TPA: OadG family transporter subunit [Clostridia bacterium]|nr:OadG family transporter subunit [Clostridia bacterium]
MLDISNFGLSDALMVSITGILVVLLELALIAVAIMIISKIIRMFGRKSDEKVDAPAYKDNTISSQAPVEQKVQSGTMVSRGSCDFINVDDASAAVIMAIVSNESGIPLNRLSFKSIKLLEGRQ